MTGKRGIAYGLSLILTCLIAAEFGRRVEDWIQFGEGLWTTPSFDHNMLIRDEYGGHGKPHGQFERWKLNASGFRGPDVSLHPSPEVTRILVLGASETFGVDESDCQEWPAQLERLLDQHGEYDVINAALPGIGISGMVAYWEHWASRFRPSLVVIYPQPLFYLGNSPPKSPRTQPAPAAPRRVENTVESRFLAHLKQVVRLPGWVQKWRLERKIAALRSNQPREWFFHSTPNQRLERLMRDLTLLVDTIRNGGTDVMVLTAAISATSTDPPSRDGNLRGWLVNVPRANEAIVLQFVQDANDRILEFASRRGVAVADVAARLSGDRDGFTDLAHFTDHGAGIVATVVADSIRARTRNRQAMSRPKSAD